MAPNRRPGRGDTADMHDSRRPPRRRPVRTSGRCRHVAARGTLAGNKYQSYAPQKTPLVLSTPGYRQLPATFGHACGPGRPDAAGMSQSFSRKWVVSAHLTQGEVDVSMLTKVFPIPLKTGQQAAAEAIVEQFASRGPGQEAGTLSCRVYRDPKRPDYLLFVEHFADQQAYDAHTGSTAYKELIAGRFASIIEEFVEIDHELVVSL
jgi:quinol monooxygenase YgiN